MQNNSSEREVISVTGPESFKHWLAGGDTRPDHKNPKPRFPFIRYFFVFHYCNTDKILSTEKRGTRVR